MTKLRRGDPWMPAAEYGRGLKGFSVNLLVADIDASLPFHTEVLDAVAVYSDPDVAVLRFGEVEWMLHAHHTYDNHPLHSIINSGEPRGIGVELRLHGRDPDAAEARALKLGYKVIAAAADKPHGLRESVILDGDGYCWVPDLPSSGNQ